MIYVSYFPIVVIYLDTNREHQSTYIWYDTEQLYSIHICFEFANVNTLKIKGDRK